MEAKSSAAANGQGSRWPAIVIGSLLGLVGLWLAAGGAWLLWLGGSSYYVLAGLGCIIAALSYLTGRETRGMAIYLLVFALTCIWAFVEVGTDFWQLLPRVAGPAVFAAVALVHWQFTRWGSRKFAWGTAGVAVVAFAALVFSITRLPPTSGRMLADPVEPGRGEDWTAFGRSQAGTRYSPASQITPANVGSLEVAWTLRTGDLPSAFPHLPGAHTFEATPLKVGNLLYLCTPHNLVIAADADTGQVRWRYDPKLNLKRPALLACRGVSYVETNDGDTACAKRILLATLDARLIALDALTGRPCSSFGTGGAVSLKEGLGRVPHGAYSVTSPPAIANGVAVVGGFTADGPDQAGPSGVIRGYDVVSGKLLWAWDPSALDENRIPGPGEQYTRGAANSWSVFSADPELGMVYVPTANVSPDYVGINRNPLDERYTSSVVALDSRTGARRWHFQTVHHDLWDYDIGSQPVLFDMPMLDGTKVPALAQPTKQGDIYVLDRRSGRPLTAVAERPVPRGSIPSERYSPTQPASVGFPSPLPAKPLREADMWGATPLDQLLCRIRFRSAEYKGRYTPPSTKRTLQYPGNYGVMDWGSISIDEGGRTMFVNSSHIPTLVQLTRVDPSGKNAPQPSAEFAPQRGTAYGASFVAMLSPLGIPCNAPPWGKLTAIDLASRRIIWQRPFGSTRDHAPLGIAVPGAPNIAGSVATAGGLLFIGASIDHYIRAFDTRTGAELWRARLPAGGQAAPMTYVSHRTGKQYVVIAAGGHQALRTGTGDYVIAYTLPRESR